MGLPVIELRARFSTATEDPDWEDMSGRACVLEKGEAGRLTVRLVDESQGRVAVVVDSDQDVAKAIHVVAEQGGQEAGVSAHAPLLCRRVLDVPALTPLGRCC